MKNPSLGAKLLALESLKKPYETEPRDSPFARAMERMAVERFFEDAQAFFKKAIGAGKRPAPLELRRHSHGPVDTAAMCAAMNTYWWPHGSSEVPQDHAYRDLWNQFKGWAESQEMEVYFTEDHDGMGQESWVSLNVRASTKVFAQQLDLAEGTVVIPKDMLQRFGSVQGYVEHLQKLAGGKA